MAPIIVTAWLRLLSCAADQAGSRSERDGAGRPRTRPNRSERSMLDHTWCMALIIGSFGVRGTCGNAPFGERLWNLRPEIVQARLLGDRIRLGWRCADRATGPHDKRKKSPDTTNQRRPSGQAAAVSLEFVATRSRSLFLLTIVDPFAPSTSSNRTPPSPIRLAHPGKWANRAYWKRDDRASQRTSKSHK